MNRGNRLIREGKLNVVPVRMSDLPDDHPMMRLYREEISYDDYNDQITKRGMKNLAEAEKRIQRKWWQFWK